MRKKISHIAAWIIALLVMTSGGTTVYADTYHELRDTEIELLLPDNWEYDEIEKSLSEGYSYEWIADAYENYNDDTALWMDIYYMHDIIDGAEAYSITEPEKAMVYFALYGKAAIETLYSELDWGESVDIGEPTFYEGEMSSQLIVPVEGDYGDGVVFHHVIYLDCATDFEARDDGNRAVVHMIKMFYTGDETPMSESNLKTAETIADNFYDYGYYEGGYFGKGDVGSEIFELILTILPFVIMIPGMIIAGIKKLPEILGENPTRPKKKKTTPMPAEKKSFGRKKSKRKSPEMKLFDRKTTYSELPRKMTESNGPRKAMSSEERYLVSLQTLRKSGLLTKEEMQDMLERHERNNSKKRSK